MSIETVKFFPSGLTNKPNWIYWRKEFDSKGRPTKIPYSPKFNGKASVNKSDTWTSYTIAKSNLKNYPISVNGLGFVFEKSLNMVFIDVDHCFNSDGSVTEIGGYVLELFKGKTYCEVSQSGSGLHFMVYGSIPRCFKNSETGVEMYFADRYCAMTFNALCPVEPCEMQTELDELFEKYKTAKKHKKRTPTLVNRTTVASIYSDSIVIEKACRNEVFRELYYRGNQSQIYQSNSEADLYMCRELAFWTDRDPDAILRIIRSSCLYRDKWERRDYQQNTIGLAIDSLSESVSEFVKRKEREKIEEYTKHFIQEE